MRVKLSKLLSAVLAICVVFAGFTAFAAPAEVVTTTNYNYATNYKDDANDDTVPAGVTMTITTKVTGVTSGKEVTYLVSKGTSEGDIVYIDQATAGESGATFTFTAPQTDIFAATAKYGTDDSDLTGLPTFTFNHGVKYLTNAPAAVTRGAVWGTLLEGTTDAYIYSGTVTGPVKAYGVKLGDVELPAMDCEITDGSFVIIVEGINATEAESITEFANE